MAGKIVGITIDIAGKTSGLVSSLKSADSALQTTNNALKSVNQALKFDGNNVDLLTSKSKLLSDAIDQNSERLDVLKATAEQAMQTLGQEGGATQAQVAELQAEIARTEQTLAGLETEAENTGSALDSLGSDAPADMEDLADASEDAAGSLDEVSQESEDAGISFDGLGTAAAATGAAIAAAMAASVAAVKEVGEALVGCTNDAASYADEMNTLSSKTGISTEKLQEMDYALGGLIDVSLETVTGSLTKLEKSMSSAASQNEKYEEKMAALNEKLKEGKISQEEWTAAAEEAEASTVTAYDQLGISITDANGNLRDSEEVFWEVIDALGEMEEGTERDLLAMDLLGKSAKELNPLIEAGSEKFNELAQEAHDVGYVMDGDTMQSFQNYQDQLDRMGKASTGAKNALGTILLPMLSDLSGTATTSLNKFTLAVKNSNGDIDKIGDAVSELLPDIFDSINKVAPKLFKLVGDVVNSLLQIFIDNLPQFTETALAIVEQLTTTLINPENIGKIMDAAVTIVLSLVEFLLNNMDMIINSALQIILALVNGISAALPELIPAAVDAILTICETLLAPDNLSMILDAALNLIIGLATGLVDALPEVIARLPEIITGIVEWLLSPEGLGKIVEAGFTLFTGLVTKMPEIIGELIVSLGTMLTDLVNYISGDMFDDITGAFGDIFGDIIESAFSWGADIIQNICDGFASMWDTLTGWIGDIAGAIGDFLGFSCPEKGPLSDWDINNPGADMMELYQSGIEAKMPSFNSVISGLASTVSNMLGFSVPKEGPLAAWGTNNPGADMVELWAQGVTSTLPQLQNSLDIMAGTIASGAAPGSVDYRSDFASINGSIADLSAREAAPIYVTAYFGNENFGTVVAQANSNNAYLSGGY